MFLRVPVYDKKLTEISCLHLSLAKFRHLLDLCSFFQSKYASILYRIIEFIAFVYDEMHFTSSQLFYSPLDT